MSFQTNKKICLLVLTVVSILLFYYNFQQREYGWDMPGYLGNYYQLEANSTPDTILENTYSDIKKEAPEYQYNIMLGNYKALSYRLFMAENSNAFVLQIPYYSIKVLYVALISLFIKTGFSPPIAAFLPNLIAFFLFGFLLFQVLKTFFFASDFLPLLLTLFALAIPPFRYLSTIPSPDMLTALFVLWFFYLFIKKEKLIYQFLILLLLVFTRPDYIIFVLSYLAMYFLYDFISKKKINYQPVLFGITTILLYFLIMRINHYPGWKDVFYDSFIKRRLWVTGNADFTFRQYVEIIRFNGSYLKKITLFSLLSVGSIFYFTKDLRLRLFAVFLFANIYLKFLFFPASGEYRFFSVFLLLLFLTAIFSARKQITHLIEKYFATI